MKHIYVRPFREGDKEDFWNWTVTNKKNDFDPAVLQLPSVKIKAAFDRTGTLGYFFFHRPIVLESFGWKPGIDELNRSLAMKEATQELVSEAYDTGAGEIYFLTSDDETAEFAKKQAYEELPYRVFRIKVADLEKPKPQI